MTKYIHDCLSVVEQEEEATMKQLTIDCVNVEAHLVNVEAHLNTCVASDLGVGAKEAEMYKTIFITKHGSVSWGRCQSCILLCSREIPFGTPLVLELSVRCER